jgi:hypothetical protein
VHYGPVIVADWYHHGPIKNGQYDGLDTQHECERKLKQSTGLITCLPWIGPREWGRIILKCILRTLDWINPAQYRAIGGPIWTWRYRASWPAQQLVASTYSLFARPMHQKVKLYRVLYRMLYCMRSSMICTPHPLLCGWKNREWDGRGM